MSVYLFGEFYFKTPLSQGEQVDLAFALTEAALRAHIHVQLGINIVYRDAFEVLERKDWGVSKESVAFMLTESRVSNTSDELIEPIGIMPLEMERVLRGRLRQVETFLKSTRAMPIKGLSLYTDSWSEGVGVPRRREDIEHEFLVGRLMDLYSEFYVIPCARFDISFLQSQ
jgi:hypothetical protein